MAWLAGSYHGALGGLVVSWQVACRVVISELGVVPWDTGAHHSQKSFCSYASARSAPLPRMPTPWSLAMNGCSGFFVYPRTQWYCRQTSGRRWISARMSVIEEFLASTSPFESPDLRDALSSEQRTSCSRHRREGHQRVSVLNPALVPFASNPISHSRSLALASGFDFFIGDQQSCGQA